jgi:hypothetical protein
VIERLWEEGEGSGSGRSHLFVGAISDENVRAANTARVAVDSGGAIRGRYSSRVHDGNLHGFDSFKSDIRPSSSGPSDI